MKRIIFALAIAGVLILGLLVYLYDVSHNKDMIMIVSPGISEKLTVNQYDFLGAVGVLRNEKPEDTYVKDLAEEDMDFSLSWGSVEEEGAYTFSIGYQWQKRQNTCGDIFFYAFNDEEWETRTSPELFCNSSSNVGIRPDNVGFAAASFILEQRDCSQGVITVTMNPLVEQPQSDILVGYIDPGFILAPGLDLRIGNNFYLPFAAAKIELLSLTGQDD